GAAFVRSVRLLQVPFRRGLPQVPDDAVRGQGARPPDLRRRADAGAAGRQPAEHRSGALGRGRQELHVPHAGQGPHAPPARGVAGGAPTPSRAPPIATHPGGALIVPTLAEAAGVPHTNPEIVFMPDDPVLGEFRATFGGQPGTIAEYPLPASGQRPGFRGAVEIIPTAELWK